MRCKALLLPALALTWGTMLAAQGPTYHLGRAPTERELQPRDALIPPNGEGLPPGKGTAKEGLLVYQTRGCTACHGPTGAEGPGPHLVGPPARALPRQIYTTHGESENNTGYIGMGITNFPFAPLIWSWINVAMPLHSQGYLSPDEVY